MMLLGFAAKIRASRPDIAMISRNRLVLRVSPMLDTRVDLMVGENSLEHHKKLQGWKFLWRREDWVGASFSLKKTSIDLNTLFHAFRFVAEK